MVTVDRATGRVTLKSTPRSFTPYRHRPPLLVEDGALALPRPPAQGSPWTPPQAAGPAPLVDATRTLLAQGLADPRGCEYREIVVGYGTVWDEGERRLITRGWVLPCERAAVTWSGLVHPLLAVGEAADLATDVEGLHRQLERQRAAFEEKTGGAFSLRRFERSGEHERLWSSSCHPLKAALLLAAGEADLARAVWASWVAALDLEVNGNAEAVARPYRTLAEDWGWALFDRAVCAHARGDDPLALTSARAAAEVCARVEDELRRRGFRDPALRFAPSLPPLLADQERRASLTRDASVPPLIAELEEASVLQGGQPGWPALEGAPQVQALIQAGTEALEDLVRCLRSDRRLTRSVRFWRAHQPERSALSVAEAAYVAIREILQVDFLQGDETLRSLDEPGFREALADRVTAFRERYGDLQGAALQAQILADDAADPSLWCAAVRHLSRPDGDALRDRTGIARHMARRAREMADAGGFPDHLRPAVGIGLALASWDRAAAAPVLRDLWARARAIEVSEDEQRPRAEALAELTVARARCGDGAALADYGAWFRAQRSPALLSSLPRCLSPLWSFPDAPALQPLAAWVFDTPDSPWRPSFLKPARPSPLALLQPPAFRVAAARRFVRAELDDTTPAGVVRIEGTSQSIRLLRRPGLHSTALDRTGDVPPSGSEIPIRTCDLYAWLVRDVPGAPDFALYWPLERRVEALTEVKNFLR